MAPVTFEAWFTATSRVSGRKAARTSSRRNKALAIARDVGDFDAGFFAQRPQRAEHRVVVADGRDDVVAGPNDAADGHVEHVGAVEAEDDVRRVVAPIRSATPRRARSTMRFDSWASR